MNNSNIDMVKLAVKIGDHSERVNVVGKNTEETKQNLLNLFAGSNARKKNNNTSNNQLHV